MGGDFFDVDCEVEVGVEVVLFMSFSSVRLREQGGQFLFKKVLLLMTRSGCPNQTVISHDEAFQAARRRALMTARVLLDLLARRPHVAKCH